MKNKTNDMVKNVRTRLVEVGGKTSQDLGLGRIIGQILIYLYLKDGECSLDIIGNDLGLSKAAVSIAARQLENLGLLRRVWKKGDRKRYYRTADDIATALQQGLLSFVSQKIRIMAAELDATTAMLKKADNVKKQNHEFDFINSRLKRAKLLHDRAVKVINSPILKFFTNI